MIEPGNVYCMDALEFLPMLENESVAMTMTDIPYGEVNNSRETHTSIRRLHRGNADDVTFALSDLLPELDRVTRHWLYIFCGMGQISEIRNYWNGRAMVRIGMWEKINPSPLNGHHIWLSAHEFCVIVRKSGATFNRFCQKAVWHYPIGDGDGHPTRKPVALFKELIEASTNPDDVVLDPFCGSGTTADACLKSGRQFIVNDRESDYVAMTRRRVANWKRDSDIEVAPGVKQLGMFAAVGE